MERCAKCVSDIKRYDVNSTETECYVFLYIEDDV